MKYAMILLMFPALLCAQEFEFQLETNTIPVEMEGWNTFAPWAGGESESSPGLCDIDADGDLDFLVGEYFGYVRFFENEGSVSTPAFSFVTDHFDSIYLEESRANPCFRDLDDDGDLDLLVGDIDSNVRYYRNIGTAQTPSYLLEDSSLVPVPPWCLGPELVDIDSDGDYDLFGGNYGQISFFCNNGSPEDFNFDLVTGEFEVIDVGDRALPDFVDIDADGDYDLFIGERYGQIWFYRNDGDSVNYDFIYVTDHFAGIDVGDFSSPEFADIDGDGDYDLFVGREPSSGSLMGDIFFYENTGSATNPQFDLVTKNYLTTDLGPYALNPQIVDLNDDQAPDLVVGATNELDYFVNVGDSANPSYSFVEEGFQGINMPVIKPFFVDIDADGDLDMFAGEGVIPGPPTVALYLNNGTPQSPQLELYNPDFITNPDFWVNTNPGGADIDADGDYDLFISDGHGHFYFYQNDGTPQWPNFILITSQWQGIQFYYPNYGWRGFNFGDLDGDGDLDLLMENSVYSNLRFYRNVGTPQSPSMVMETDSLLTDHWIYSPCSYLVDIDLDSDLDLFIGDGDGGLMFFRNVTGEPPAVPPVMLHPQAGLELSLGPNPANPVTWISFTLPYPQEATLAIYNILGAKITTLSSGLQPAGSHTFLWNASQNASGVYIVRLETAKYTSSQRMIVVK